MIIPSIMQIIVLIAIVLCVQYYFDPKFRRDINAMKTSFFWWSDSKVIDGDSLKGDTGKTWFEKFGILYIKIIGIIICLFFVLPLLISYFGWFWTFIIVSIVLRNKKIGVWVEHRLLELLDYIQTHILPWLRKVEKRDISSSEPIKTVDVATSYQNTTTNHNTSNQDKTAAQSSVFNHSTHTMSNFPSLKRIFYRILWFVLLILIFSTGLPWFTVSPGEVGLIVRLGKLQEAVYTEGLNFKVPLIDKVVKINIQTQKVQATAESASKDLQNITATIAVNGNIKASSAIEIYRNVGNTEYISDKIIAPAIQESVKAATAKYTAEELIAKRTLVSQDIKASLVEKLAKYGFNISDVNIVNFQFSQWFDQAIEAKVKAEQEAFAEKNKLESVKFQAQQSIERAKAEAESIRIQAEAIKSQGGAEYVNLKWIEKWDGKLPTTSLANSNGLIYNLNK